jgi:hypothetical protein
MSWLFFKAGHLSKLTVTGLYAWFQVIDVDSNDDGPAVPHRLESVEQETRKYARLSSGINVTELHIRGVLLHATTETDC